MGSLIVLGATAACSSGGTFSGKGDGGHTPASGGTLGGGGSGGDVDGSHSGGATSGGSASGGSSGASTGGSSAIVDGGSGPDATVDGGETPIDGGTVDAGPVLPIGRDPCSKADVPNEDPDHARPYALGSAFEGCLQTSDDLDYYAFTAPAKPVEGGFVVIKATGVGMKGSLHIEAEAAADDGDIWDVSAPDGTSAFVWFNVKAGAKFFAKINAAYTLDAATPYTLTIDYTGVPDAHEPNDTRAQATPMTSGKAVHGYLFAGYESSLGIAAQDWDDWYKVTLPAGPATFTLSDLASDDSGDLSLYDATGSSVDGANNTTFGADVTFTHTIATAGDYYVDVKPQYPPASKGTGYTVPAYETQPYTLTVTAGN
jgi:hypothetical protein